MQAEPRKASFWALALIILAAAIVVFVSPAEKTLGNGIKPVYVHVSLTWAGMLTFWLTAVLGIWGLVRPGEKRFAWLKVFYFVAFGIYLAGFLVSMLASIVNWGGVPFREPRVLSTINVLVVSAVGGVILVWLRRFRAANLLAVLPLVVIYWSAQSSRLVLHPDSPVSSAPTGIRNSFLGMFILAIALTIWLIAYFRPGTEPLES